MSDDPTTSHPSFQSVPPASEPLPPADPIAPAMAPAASTASPGPTLEPVQPIAPAKRRASSGRWLNLLLGVAVAVAIGGIAFAVGRSTAPAQAATFQRGAGNGTFAFPGGSFDPNAAGNGGNGTGGFGGRFGLGGTAVTLDGTVDSVSADSITITTASGQQLTLTLNGTTAYHTQSPATAADVKSGSKVAVQVQLTGGFRGNGNGGNNGNGNGNNGNGNSGNGNNGNGGNGGGQAGSSGAPTVRGTASDVTVIP